MMAANLYYLNQWMTKWWMSDEWWMSVRELFQLKTVLSWFCFLNYYFTWKGYWSSHWSSSVVHSVSWSQAADFIHSWTIDLLHKTGWDTSTFSHINTCTLCFAGSASWDCHMATASGQQLLKHPEIVHSAVVLVLKDDGFSLPTAPAQMARKTAEKLLEWNSENKEAWRSFSESQQL